MKLRPRLITSMAILAIMAGSLSACATRYTIKSYPEGATVYVKDVVTNEKKVAGTTPLVIKKTKEMGEVFFLTVEKDNFFPKQILMTPKEGENLMVSVNLDPMADQNRAIASDKNGNQPQQSPQQKPEDKKNDAKALQDMQLRLALLENTVSMYKDALFSYRYAGAVPPKYDRDRNDDVVDHLFKAQQLVMQKNFSGALQEVDQALLIDEYSPQAYLIKGSIFYVNKQFDQAKISWERALKIDPYNTKAFQYLRLVDKKLGLSSVPDRPSQLRAPASEALTKDLSKDLDSLNKTR